MTCIFYLKCTEKIITCLFFIVMLINAYILYDTLVYINENLHILVLLLSCWKLDGF